VIRRIVGGDAFLWLLVGLSGPGCHRAEARAAQIVNVAPAVSGTAAPGGRSGTATEIRVQAEMRDVNFHVDSDIVLHIRRLRGELVPTETNVPPSLDDKQSFILSMGSSEIAIDVVSLSTLLNRYVFAYAASPIKQLRISTDGEQLVQQGVLSRGAGVHFAIRATVALTPDGQIRLHPTSVKVMGVKVGGLLNFFGKHLDQVMRLEPGHGARIEEDDFILDPTGIIPAPVIRGRLSFIHIEDGLLVQTFGPADPTGVRSLRGPNSAAPNYVYFRGGTLRFGRLTMSDADLEIDDNDPSNPFDFSLDHYNDQLVAGYATSTITHGLIVHMPDLGTLRSIVEAARSGTVAH
jgi:hypothetical protein